MRRPSRDEIAGRAARIAVICEQQRVATLNNLRTEAEQERAAHAERIARMLQGAGYSEAAAYVRANGSRR